MKSIKLFSALAFATTLFVQTLAANNIENFYDMDGTPLRIAASSENVIVDLGTVEKEEITITIKNNDDITLLTEKVKNVKDFAKKYNVKRLEDGAYRMIITKKTIRTVQPFTMEKGKVIMSPNEKKEKFLPTISFSNNKLDVNVLLGNYSNILVKVYDTEGNIVVDEKHYVALQLNKRFNMEKLQTGRYTAEVKAGDETFSYTFKK
jgi:hypothetical protein